MLTNHVYHGDAIEIMRTFPDNSIDSVVTDPPYGISFMAKGWDTFSGNKQYAEWCEQWARECLRVLKPGGHLLAFSGTRTYHALAWGVESAGFEIRDMIEWLYLSGFPKSMDISKQFDKMAGAEREVIGKNPNARITRSDKFNNGQGVWVNESITAPATPLAKQWDGWGTALKPAHESIVCARKPKTLSDLTDEHLQEVVKCLTLFVSIAVKHSLLNQSALDAALNTVRWNVDENINTLDDFNGQTDTSQFAPILANMSWNIVLSCLNILGENLNLGNTFTTETALNLITELRTLNYLRSVNTLKYTLMEKMKHDGSSANVQIVGNDLNDELLKLNDILTRFVQETATSKENERGSHHNHEPIVMARKPLEGTVCANVEKYGTGAINVDGCRIPANDGVNRARPPRTPNAIYGGGKGTNTTASEHNELGRFPANCITLDDDAWYSKYFNVSPQDISKKASKSDRNSNWLGEIVCDNKHATVKPTNLMAWLIRLVTPPNGIVLDPFAGSGSTLVAAKREGFAYIGIEREQEYIPTIHLRLADK